ncbi:MAG: HAMP domain-containing sensor histidine kinase, partial [Micrococcus sp.]|nr:HAMP domain-containing sensor histidine kinase [Micrococcus sp.]
EVDGEADSTSRAPVWLRSRSLAVRVAVGIAALTVVVCSVYVAIVFHATRVTIEERQIDALTSAWLRSERQIVQAEQGAETSAIPSLVPSLGDDELADTVESAIPSGVGLVSGSLVAVFPGAVMDTRQHEMLEEHMRAFIVDPLGMRRHLTPEEGEELAISLLAAPVRDAQRLTVDSEVYLVQWGAIHDSGGPTERILAVGVPVSDQDRFQAGILAATVSLIALVMGTLALGSWWWIRHSLRRLRVVAERAEAVADLPLGSETVDLQRHRVPPSVVGSRDEIAVVGVALNMLIDSVGEALDERDTSEGELRQFVADASHELRTPLASMRGYTEMLALTENLTSQGRENLERVRTQTDRMSALVEDLLLLAHLQASEDPATQPGTLRSVDITELVLEAVADNHAAGPEHDWHLDVDDAVLGDEIVVLGDPLQLHRVLTNLLSNARKHTPAGTCVSTRVSVVWGARTGRAMAVRVDVEDNGPGIPVALQARMFDRFVRGSAAREPQEGSTGLGLSIAQAVAQAHRGAITVASEPGKTVFTLTLPLHRTCGG